MSFLCSRTRCRLVCGQGDTNVRLFKALELPLPNEKARLSDLPQRLPSVMVLSNGHALDFAAKFEMLFELFFICAEVDVLDEDAPLVRVVCTCCVLAALTRVFL